MKKDAKAPEAKASGIQVSTKTIVTITDSYGEAIERGDLILLKIRDEDILCTFQELNAGGYFVTRAFTDPKTENKYRIGSIERCCKVKTDTFKDSEITINKQED